MEKILFFSKKELAVVIAVGLITGLLDDNIERLEFAAVARVHALVLLNDYLGFVTGGPLFGDLLQTWLEFGGVLAACLVRKPAAGMFALTINGFIQVFVHASHDPHLLYAAPGLGADVVFALTRYRRYDAPVICLAGISSAVFWYPIVWFTHGIYLYPLAFIISDLAVRALGSAVGDGLVAGALAFVILRLAGRRWDAPGASTLMSEHGQEKTMSSSSFANALALLVVSLGVLLIVLTHAIPSLSSFFLSIGPNIPAGDPHTEEYNPGYVIGVLLIFLSLATLVFWNLRSRI